MATKLKAWTGRSGERRVYIHTRYARDVPRSLAKFADGAFFTEAPDGALQALGQGETKQAAAMAVADWLGITTFADAIELSAK